MEILNPKPQTPSKTALTSPKPQTLSLKSVKPRLQSPLSAGMLEFVSVLGVGSAAHTCSEKTCYLLMTSIYGPLIKGSLL